MTAICLHGLLNILNPLLGLNDKYIYVGERGHGFIVHRQDSPDLWWEAWQPCARPGRGWWQLPRLARPVERLWLEVVSP